VIVVGLLIAYVLYIVLFGLAPFTFSLGDADSFRSIYQDKFEGFSGISRVTLWDIWTNILYFIPCGFLIVLLPQTYSRGWRFKLLLISGVSVLLSGFVEMAQVFLPRAPSVADILCNWLGGVVGGLAGVLFQAALPTLKASRWQRVWRRPVAGTMAGVYVVLLAVAIGMPLTVPRDFRNWNSSYRLFLGNEGTLDRPWQGAIYLAALYDRALTADAVWTNFSAGYGVDAHTKRIQEDLVFYYDFTEQHGTIVHDRSALRPPIDLQISEKAKYTWLSPNGLLFKGGSGASSLIAPQKLADMPLTYQKELSLETWVASGELNQGGPARIVSYSIDPYDRNFTLAQQNREIVFRLRTPVSGRNGAHPALTTVDSPLDRSVQHLVAVYRDGVTMLYVNGREHARMVVQQQLSVSDMLIRGLGETFKWLVYSVLIFPLGIASRFAFLELPHGPGRLLSLGLGLLGFFLAQGLRVLTFNAPLDPLLMLVGASTLAIAVVLLPSPSCVV